ncbi:WD40-repeat-containing domain protein [Fennellomyces sp. T-0311]|nr:WD40-repeat-containing domain protein [Fennellomyces sp. T-0311]
MIGDRSVWEQMISECEDLYPIQQLPEGTSQKLQKFPKPARANYEELEEAVGDWKPSSFRDQLSKVKIALNNIIPLCKPSSVLREQSHESMFTISAVTPLLIAFLEEDVHLIRRGTVCEIVGSKKRLHTADPSAQTARRFSDLSMMFSYGKLPDQNLLIVETKPPHRVKNGERPDFIKLANAMKDAIDNMVRCGMDDEEIPVVGILIVGFICIVLIMDFRYQGMYRLIPISTFYIPRVHTDFSVLDDAFETMLTVQKLVETNANTLFQFVCPLIKADVFVQKRKDSPSIYAAGGTLIKRARRDTEEKGKKFILSPERSGTSNAIVGTIKRMSCRQAPDEIFSSKFYPSSQHIASASYDRQILLWDTYGDCQNYVVLRGHTNIILDVHWSQKVDKAVCIYDPSTGERVRQWKGHTLVVNSCHVARRGPEHVVSGSDDGCIKLWDSRSKDAVQTYEDKYQVTSVCFSDAGNMIYSGGLDNEIKVWDMRKKEVAYTLKGHMDTVAGLALSPDGASLLSNSMDNTVRIWNVKPFAPADRRMKVLQGAPHGYEKNLITPCWFTDGSQVACGSADRTVVIWEASSGKILYKLPGHKGCVNDVDWYPKEPIIIGCSTDMTILLGEVKDTQ